MAFFRINKHALTDPPTAGALFSSFTNIEEFNPTGDGEHPTFKWFWVDGPGIPDHSCEIELQFIKDASGKASIQWRLKSIIT